MIKKNDQIIVGVDLDNTIINYEELLFSEALNADYISTGFIKDKKSIRDHIRSLKNGEIKWQKLQALIYGKNIINSKLYEGVKDFFNLCRHLNIKVYIISHKTRYSAIDKTIDLRKSALCFLQKQNFFSENLIKFEDILFESTKEKKINRINELNCDLFIDDLIDIFADPFFPEHTTKILFDTNNTTNYFVKNVNAMESWEKIIGFLVKTDKDTKIKKLLNKHFNYCNQSDKTHNNISYTHINNGKNSRVYLVNYGLKTFIVKFYVNDKRDRMKREKMAFSFFAANKFCNVPALLYTDFQNRCSLFQYIKGEKIDENKIVYADIDCFVNFIKQIKATGQYSNGIMNAADACLSHRQAIDIIYNRIEKLKQNTSTDLSINELNNNELNVKLFNFIENDLNPYWETTNKNIVEISKTNQIPFDSELDKKYQILSPSDFGFHNALRSENGTIFFIDFEYFGWDDPVKLILDFIIHPGMNIDISFKKYFFQKMIKLFLDDEKFKVRIAMYLPVLIIKWILIVLNEFIPEYCNYRKLDNKFNKNLKHRQIIQFEKAVKIFNTKEMLINNVEEWINEI